MEDRARILEDRVEDLAREIIRTINEAEVVGQPALRGELKEFAIALIQDSVTLADTAPLPPVEQGSEGFSPIAMGIPLLVAGGVLVFLFPPVGMMLFAAAGALIVWGLVASIFVRRRG